MSCTTGSGSASRRFAITSRILRATLEDRLVYSTVFTVTFLREHALLKKLLRAEPETILPSLTVEAGAIVDFATEQSAAMLRAEIYGATATTPAQERHLRTVA